MPLNSEEINDLKNLLKKRVENYPDLDQMVADGKLKYKAGWYELTDKASYEAVIHYATAIKINNDGKAQVKISKMRKKLKSLAEKI